MRWARFGISPYGIPGYLDPGIHGYQSFVIWKSCDPQNLGSLDPGISGPRDLGSNKSGDKLINGLVVAMARVWLFILCRRKMKKWHYCVFLKRWWNCERRKLKCAGTCEQVSGSTNPWSVNLSFFFVLIKWMWAEISSSKYFLAWVVIFFILRKVNICFLKMSWLIYNIIFHNKF